MNNFDEIFGPGNFDDENKRYEREFLGTETGKTRNVLDFSTLWEHAKRHGYEAIPYPNGDSKNLELKNSKMDIEIQNFSDGRTALSIDFDEDIDNIEAYMRNSVDGWLGEIIRREQKAYQAATNYVHNVIPRKAEERGLTEKELLSNQLRVSRGNLAQFHENYRRGPPNDLGMSYAAQFELLPFQESEMDRSELKGRMPAADEVEDPELRSRNDLYQRMFLEAVVEEAIGQYDLGDDFRESWLEYVDAGFR